ncbi:FAD-binding oxidoreductase [Oceanicoccus sp. KOV_DT_Chl]|uniref:FAD-binding oxidoreductase n=1 Tax=Oceanicoccus sp. KOV_DT_Chl TaxID=1904639 RepID=UPI000C7AB647|nr:FAD-binding oxidoreductase [Oceanicoccus sp. KOV_DT_Chl]
MSVVVSLQQIVGEQYCLLDEESRVFYSMDIWSRGETAIAVVQPENAEQLSQVVAAATTAGHAVIARGGGMSYTKAYTPDHPDAVMIDCSRMNKIIEINREDMYVTVEAGCTWKALHEALKGSGVRTPYWGPLSGIKATVGGSVSQNSIFWGGGSYGSAADSVVSMDVVVADGTILSTGSAAQKNGTPFFRHFGPDLTGLFTCDCGALGIKAAVTLRLTPELGAHRYVAFDFADHHGLLATMNEISRSALAAECFGFDPLLTEMRAQRDSLVNDAKAFAGVLKNSGSVMGALKDGAKLALAGRRFMKDLRWPMYVVIEERVAAAAEDALEKVVAIGKKHGGNEVENSIPKIIRANPFGPVNNMIGPGGERWAPVHALMPLSKASAATEAVLAIFAKHAALIEQYQIKTGFLYNNVSTNCIAVEPLFFWPDAVDEIQKASVEPAFYQKVVKHNEDLVARAAVAKIRQEVADLFSEMGGVHLQVGRSYHYKTGLKKNAFDLVASIKKVVDPNGKINPGVLGL